jgi:hypothetical protein
MNIGVRSGLRFGAAVPPAPCPGRTAKGKPPRERVARAKVKVDPHLVARSRELRDRYLEQVNDRMPLEVARGKYDVSRAPRALSAPKVARPMRLLKAG